MASLWRYNLMSEAVQEPQEVFIPVIAIVGRPNVGKSTLFNRLTKTSNAIVADMPGVTRDRQYGEGRLGDKPYFVIDTGGIGTEEHPIDDLTTEQVQLAIQEADVILFMVDGRAGAVNADIAVASELRKLAKPSFLVVNKTDGIDEDVAMSDFYQLGMDEPIAIAASHGRGVTQLINHVLEPYEYVEPEEEDTSKGIKIAVVGRPNVGKSTLVNRMLGEERVLVFDMPGTTRDSIFIPFKRFDQEYTLIDTAGVRRRGKIKEAVEKFSIIKAMQAVKAANVVIMVMDAQEGITDQDLRLLAFVIDSGRSLVIAVNKWDDLPGGQKQSIKDTIDRRLNFVDFAKIHRISALHGTGVGDLFDFVNKAYASAMQELTSSRLTKILESAIEEHQPPLVRGRRIKLRYAHPGGHNPPIIVIHGNQTSEVPESYKRYLINVYRKALRLVGTPVRIIFKSGDNPFAGRRNKLTPRQEQKRRRMKKFTKKKK